MPYIDFLSTLHNSTKRDYVARVNEHDKAECSQVAKLFGYDYWDGERQYGYGGYKYDGRWRPIAEQIANHYSLNADSKILDVGCGKGYLLYEFTQAVPGISVSGIDISEYAIEHSKQEIRPFVQKASATKLPFDNDQFDLVISLGTLHNLYIFDLVSAIEEIQRVGKTSKYIAVESYRNESEKANLLYWQLTCESFYTPDEWDWLYGNNGYTGDYGFIFFE